MLIDNLEEIKLTGVLRHTLISPGGVGDGVGRGRKYKDGLQQSAPQTDKRWQNGITIGASTKFVQKRSLWFSMSTEGCLPLTPKSRRVHPCFHAVFYGKKAVKSLPEQCFQKFVNLHHELHYKQTHPSNARTGLTCYSASYPPHCMPAAWTTRAERAWLHSKLSLFRDHQRLGTTDKFWILIFKQFCDEFPARVVAEKKRLEEIQDVSSKQNGKSRIVLFHTNCSYLKLLLCRNKQVRQKVCPT
jgi:hypothetical protein